MENRVENVVASRPAAASAIVAPAVGGRLNGSWWLFSAPVDLGVFLGSALAALLALTLGAYFGLLNNAGHRPDFAWIPAVLLIDVAHVYATAYRVYLDPGEIKRRPLLYMLVPLVGLVIGITLYSQGELLFWRVLAYVAVFHFVRQQYGWVALYRARLGERDSFSFWLDASAIYLATIYPLIYWHCHLPREFRWFLENDFIAIPARLDQLVAPVYWAVLATYALRSTYCWLVLRRPNPGKDIVVATTAVCWYAGIVAFNSDYAFTVTNVIIHGVPYMALVYWYWMRRRAAGLIPAGALARPSHWRMLLIFLATLWLAAYIEEMFWDRGVWHRQSWLFGGAWDLGWFKGVLVPLLAVPQFTHYILDGFIWRRKSNPNLAELFATKPAALDA